MKKKYLLIFCVSALFIIIGCSTKKKSQPLVDIEIETIDFSTLMKLDGYIPQSLVKSIKYILLDNSSEVLFKRIDKIKITEDRIYVLDSRLKRLIVFDSAGVGLGRIGSRGQGPEEYLQVTDFDVNNVGDVYFIDATGGNHDRLFVFNKDFSFNSVKKMPFEADIIQCLPNNKLLFGLSSWNKAENASQKIALTDLNLKTEQSYMEYDEYVDERYWISDYTFIENGTNVLYNKQIDNFVYEVSPEGQLVKAYFFDFGTKNVPNEYKKDVEKNLKKLEYYCCLKNFVVINAKYILGTLWDRTKTKTFLVDRNSQKLYMSDEVASSDISNIAGYCNNQIISYIYPGKYDDIQAMDFPEDVKKHVEDENFVLCLYTLN
jgi:hypothetical protein